MPKFGVMTKKLDLWGGWYKKGRVEAFTDGVVAIAATFIALELKVEPNVQAENWLNENVDKITCMVLTVFILFALLMIHHTMFGYFNEEMSHNIDIHMAAV